MRLKDLIKSNRYLSKVAYNVLYAKVATKQKKENVDEMKQLEKLKGIHSGKRCFIIGTGPSLTVADLELLENEITFGPNRIYELFEQTKWRPTYYINQDHNLIQTFSEKIRNVDAEMVFLPVEYKEKYQGDKYRFFVLKHKEFYPKKAPFSKDITQFLAQGFTVTYGAIQIAAYMGFKEIYLLGIDHNYNISRDAKGRPVKNGDNEGNYSKGMKEYINMSNLPRVEETTVAFETAESISYKNGFRIYNVTRGGKLEAFERKQLEEVLGKNNEREDLKL